MSSSDSAEAIGPMMAFSRRPDRKNTNCHCKNFSRCPANDGIAGALETPFAP